MKNSKFIKLFSALLCIVMLFVSCDKSNDDPNNNNNAPKEPTTLSFAEVYLNNYEPDTAAKLDSAEKLEYGEDYDSDYAYNLVLFSENDYDHLGNMMFKQTAYNFELGKPVLSVEAHLNMDTDVHYGDASMPFDVIVVNTPTISISYLEYEDDEDEYYLPVVVVSTVKANETSDERRNELLDNVKTALGLTDAMIERGFYTDDDITSEQMMINEILFEYYEIADTIPDYLYYVCYEIYDVEGTKLAAVSTPEFGSYNLEDRDDVLDSKTLSFESFFEYCEDDLVEYCGNAKFGPIYRFGDKIVNFNSESGKAISVSDYYGQVVHAFDAETDKYGYYFKTSEDVAFQIYDKESGNLAHCEYVVFDATKYDIDFVDVVTDYYVLNNGNVLITLNCTLDKDAENYTYAINSSKHYYDALVFNVEDGTFASVYDGSYIINSITSYADLKHEADMRDELLLYTDKVQNVANITYVNDKILGDDEDSVILNNSLEVVYKNDFASLALEHNAYSVGDFLANGDILVSLYEGAATSKAIIKADGALRCYLPESASVLDGFILTDVAVYDYDLNLIFDFAENDCELLSGDILFGGKLVVYFTDVEYYEYDKKVQELYVTDSDEDGTCDMYDDDYTDDIKTEYQNGSRSNTSGFYALEYVDGAFVKNTISAFANFSKEAFYIDTDESDANMLVTYNESTMKNEIYNTDFELLVSTTEDIYVFRFGDFYYVEHALYVEGIVNEWVYYALNGAAHE